MARTTTFSDLKEFARRRANDSLDKKNIEYIEEAIQDALRNISQIKKWTFLQEETRVTTKAHSTVGRVSIDDGSQIVTGQSTGFSSLGVGVNWAIKFNGENTDYYVGSSISVSATSLGITHEYVGTTNLSSVAYIVYQRSYDLPVNFREMLHIVDVQQPTVRLSIVNQSAMLRRNQTRNDGARPYQYSIENKNSDAVRQLWLFPSPDGRYQYDLVYSRWPTNPTADTDIIDWPDNEMHVLKAAIEVELAQKYNDPEWLDIARQQFADKLMTAGGGDIEDSSPSYFIGTSIRRDNGHLWEGRDVSVTDQSAQI